MVRESRHLWVGNLPETVREEQIQDYFSRFGRVEKVKLLPKTSPDGGRAAFVDFVDIRSATKANEAQNRMGERELRTNYNEPGKGPDYRNRMHHNVHHGGYHHPPPPGMEYRPPVVIYTGPPPPPGEHLMPAPPYRPPIFPREELQPVFPPRRRKSPVSRASNSPEREISPGLAGDSSDSDGEGLPSSILIKNLDPRTNDSSLEEALYHEFKKYGEIVNIKIKGAGPERVAFVKFAKPEEAEESMQSNGKNFLGEEIRVFIKIRKRQPTGEMEFDPHATRTVFVGNLEKTMMHGELRDIFEQFGDVVDVDIKKMQQGLTTYAFVQYIDLNGAMLAKRKMDRNLLGNNRLKVGYGRGTPTNSLWVGNLPPATDEHQLAKVFHPFGFVQRCLLDTQMWQALVRFETIESCTRAFADMHGKLFMGRRLAVDYASPACRDGFYSRMEKNGLLDRRRLEPSPTPPDAHLNFQNVARGGFVHRGVYNQGRPNFVPTPPGYIPPKEPIIFRDDGFVERPRLEYDRRQPEFYGRERIPAERSGRSPMSRHSRESLSPTRDKKKKRKLSIGSPEEYLRKKEKKKRKEKKEAKRKRMKERMEQYALNEALMEQEMKKSQAQLKKERKERKKAEKARRKAERKEKKLQKLREMEEKLKTIQSSVANQNPVDTMADSIKEELKRETFEVSDSSQTDNKRPLDVGVRKTTDEISEGEAPQGVVEYKLSGSVNGASTMPQSLPPIKSPSRILSKRKRKISDSSDSSSSSSSSSSGSDSDSSDGEDVRSYKENKERIRKTLSKQDKIEPKAYRSDSREGFGRSRNVSHDSRQKREYSDSKLSGSDDRHSPRGYNRRSSSQEDQIKSSHRMRSRSRSPRYTREESYDRIRGRSPIRRSPHLEPRYGSPPPPPPPGKEGSRPIPNQGGIPGSNNGQNNETYLDLLVRFPVMWQGHLGLKNDTAAVQMHFLSGNIKLGKNTILRAAQLNDGPPPLRISQRMKLEPSQLDGVDKRISQQQEHCMLLALPCGTDPLDVHAQTRALKTGFITYLQQKQAAGIINVPNPGTKQIAHVVHIFPPCDFAQEHLAHAAPELLKSAHSGYLMVLVTPA